MHRISHSGGGYSYIPHQAGGSWFSDAMSSVGNALGSAGRAVGRVVAPAAGMALNAARGLVAPAIGIAKGAIGNFVNSGGIGRSIGKIDNGSAQALSRFVTQRGYGKKFIKVAHVGGGYTHVPMQAGGAWYSSFVKTLKHAAHELHGHVKSSKAISGAVRPQGRLRQRCQCDRAEGLRRWRRPNGGQSAAPGAGAATTLERDGHVGRCEKEAKGRTQAPQYHWWRPEPFRLG
jgi:hypothetical protein